MFTQKQLLLRLLVVILSISMIVVFSLASCKKEVAPVEEEAVAPVEEEAAPAEEAVEEKTVLAEEEFTNANINWRQVAEKAPEEGVTLHVAMVKHPFTESLLPLISSFEELTGIKVLYDILPQDEYWPKVTIDMSSGAGLIDVFMTGPELNWQYIPPGWIEPLDAYIDNTQLTDSEWYDFGDFYSPAIDANRWDGETLGREAYGEGPLYAIPVTYEIMSLTYRTDLFEEAGIVVGEGWPHTWQDILDAAKKLTKDTDNDGEIDQYGIIGRGSKTWATMFGGYSNIFYSYGAKDFDENMEPIMNSQRGIEATELWVELMQSCTPPGVTDLQWFQVKQAFASGIGAMSIDCDWFPAATYENPDVSKVAGKLSYALTPPGPDGYRLEDLWFWSLGMNSASYHKDAAWQFIQWATSKPVMLQGTLQYENWNPPRKSVWENPDVAAKSEKWGNYREIVEENRKYTKVPHAVNPQVFAVLDNLVGNVQLAILGDLTAKEALDRTVEETHDIMERAGVYK